MHCTTNPPHTTHIPVAYHTCLAGAPDSDTVSKGKAFVENFVATVSSMFGNNFRDYFKILIGFWYVNPTMCVCVCVCV